MANAEPDTGSPHDPTQVSDSTYKTYSTGPQPAPLLRPSGRAAGQLSKRSTRQPRHQTGYDSDGSSLGCEAAIPSGTRDFGGDDSAHVSVSGALGGAELPVPQEAHCVAMAWAQLRHGAPPPQGAPQPSAAISVVGSSAERALAWGETSADGTTLTGRITGHAAGHMSGLHQPAASHLHATGHAKGQQGGAPATWVTLLPMHPSQPAVLLPPSAGSQSFVAGGGGDVDEMASAAPRGEGGGASVEEAGAGPLPTAPCPAVVTLPPPGAHGPPTSILSPAQSAAAGVTPMSAAAHPIRGAASVVPGRGGQD